LPARLVNEYLKDLTPQDEKDKLIIARNTGFGHRPKGTGRPTKKERRNIDRLQDNLSD
jgi:ribosome-associated heat shock protein Hsp15